ETEGRGHTDCGHLRGAQHAIVKAYLVQRAFKTKPVTIMGQTELNLLGRQPGPCPGIRLVTAGAAIDINANAARIRLVIDVGDMMPLAVIDGALRGKRIHTTP